MDEFLRVLLLQEYNTRLVVIGTVLLGIACGTVGSLLLLRRRALVGDVISHATLPGVAIAFIVMLLLGGSGRWSPGLLMGAGCAGLIAAGLVLLIRRTTLLKDDAAMAIVMSTTFGLGIAFLGVIQDLPSGNQAGLDSIIFGKTASMIRSEAIGIGIAAIVILFTCMFLYKEFRLLCFDEHYAGSQGWPVLVLDVTLLTLGTAVTVIGLRAVGLILILAMLVIPAAAARYWTDRLMSMMWTAAGLGAFSAWIGVTISALVPRMPAGAIIVLSASAVFLISILLGTRRGIVMQLWHVVQLKRRVGKQHILRAIWECSEGQRSVQTAELLQRRSWSSRSVDRLLRASRRRHEVTIDSSGVMLTDSGALEARQIVRNHRLGELFLIRHADIAPNHVDRDADAIEHVLGNEMVAELETALLQDESIPTSPHAIEGVQP